MKTYLRLLSFSRPYSNYVPEYVVLVVLAIIFGIVNFTLLIPLLNVLFQTYEAVTLPLKPAFEFSVSYIKDLFNYFFSYSIINYGKTGALNLVCGIILVCVLLSNLFKYLSQRVLTRMRTHVVKEIRKALAAKFVSLPLGYVNKQQKGNMMSIISNDVHEIENSVVSSVQVVFREPLLIIGYLVLLFVLSPKLTMFTLVFLPISGLLITRISKQLRRQASESQTILGKLLSITEETISGTRIIKAFNAQERMKATFGKENDRFASLLKSMINKRELASPVSEFLGVLTVVGVLLYGGHLVLGQSTELSASEFLTYIVLFSQILPPAKNISTAIANIQRGLAAGERVLEILDQEEEKLEMPGAASITGFNSSIKYSGVSFAYDGKEVLKNIDLEISKGRVVALVGQSGAGKSTLADLLPGFYFPTKGNILLDGIPTDKLNLKQLRSLMGIVTQEPILFNDTVFNNIAFGTPGATKEQVLEAARIANAHEFIEKMSEQYETMIGERGSRLSGGQRQRLSIARAVLKNPTILILDEATSSLDTESEKMVQHAIHNLMQGRTSLVIAHRLSTIMNADEIVVMQQGEIAEKGTHQELLQKNGIYRKLFDLQIFETE